MNPKTWLLIKGLTVILLLWALVGVVIKVAGSLKPTPERIERYVDKLSLSGIEDPEKRKEAIGKIAEMMNQLEPEDFKKFDEEKSREAQRKLFSEMTPEEQWYFMEKRMGRAFSQMMQVFNEMERGERKRMVEEALDNMRRENGENRGPPMDEADPEMVEKVAEAGLEAYFREASAETKVDLAPLMEEVQNRMGSPGRRRDRPFRGN